jgi:hypothetical protein
MKFSCNRAMALLVISSAFLLAIAGCSKSNNGSSSSGITASVNGTAWGNTFATVGLYAKAAGTFQIIGAQYKSGDSTAFGLAFVSPITLNSAMSSGSASIDVSYINAKTQAIYDGSAIAGGHSILTVTSYDSTGHKVGGTFSGVLYNEANQNDSLVITNGKFNSGFTVQ